MSLTINSQYDPGCHAARPRDRRLRFGMEIGDGNTQAPLRARHSPEPPGFWQLARTAIAGLCVISTPLSHTGWDAFV